MVDQKPDHTKNPNPNSYNISSVLTILLAVVLVIAGVAFTLITNQNNMTPNPTVIRTPDHNDPEIELALFATGFPNPTGIVSTGQSDDNRLFVLDRSGIIRTVTTEGETFPEPFLDIGGMVLGSDEMGLLGMAFSPDFERDNTFYVSYVDRQQNSTVARYRTNDDKSQANPDSAEIILTLKQPYTNHNGGDVVFGPDGYLYVAFGDGGGQGDPGNRSQDLGTWFGKILRLDVSKTPYQIPETNPFVNHNGAAPEVWSYGLRNPWRISFDKETGDLYLADVGGNAFEEVNFQANGSPGGVNYGWRCYEANAEHNLGGCASREDYTFPVVNYDHNDTRCSVTGGYVYRGQLYPALAGRYFYGDFCSGQLFWTEKDGGEWTGTLAAATPYMFSTFGQDNNGELYVADFKTGSIYHIQDTAN